MARPIRLQIAGGVYHIVSRGNARQEIFLDDADRRCFLATLEAVVERLNVICHAFCLMGNHYHLLVETPDANLSRSIRQLNGVYAQSFNRRHRRVGHLFQGRFTSRLVEKETYLLIVCRYIVLNPVRAQLAPHPADWVWSSYRAHAGYDAPPPFLAQDWLLTSFDTMNRSRAEQAYRSFVDDGMQASKPAVTDVPILGSEAFVASFRGNLRATAALKDIPRTQRFAARPPLREILSGWKERKDRDARIRQAHIGHGYTMTEIAQHLRLHVMTISRAVRKNVEM